MADISKITLLDGNQYNIKDTVARERISEIPSWALASTKPTYTASEVDAAASSHTHGNITNTGDITTIATISSGDRLIINDESESKLNNSSIKFGTKTTQYLANNGTWQDLTQLYKYAGSGDGKVSVNSNKVELSVTNEYPYAANTLTLTSASTTIKKVVTPTEDGDAANKKYVDDTVASVAASGGVSITNTLSSGTLIATINGTNIYAPAYTDADGVSY